MAVISSRAEGGQRMGHGWAMDGVSKEKAVQL